MIRRPPRSTRTDHSFPTRRSSDLVYTLKAVFSVVGQDEARSEAQVDFGLRELRTEKEQLFLNTRRVFLRGTLECSIFPLTGHPPTGKEGWLNVFLEIGRASCRERVGQYV